MSKAVFTTKINPTYDDLPEVRYHFPSTYLGAVKKTVGDWIIYYEPRRSSSELSSTGGRQAYFAVARVTDIINDEAWKNHYYALVDHFIEFDRSVPFREGSFYYEQGLQKDDGSTNKGAFGRAVRILPDQQFNHILKAGFALSLDTRSGRQDQHHPERASGFKENQTEFERPILESIIHRPFRDDLFKKQIRQIYQQTCAVTGLKIINGGGRPEVQAAHIRPVSEKGPDSVRNGLALCGTVHWMFDRGLISIDDDYSIITANNAIPEQIDRLIKPDRRLILPEHTEARPHAIYLQYHRQHVFKG